MQLLASRGGGKLGTEKGEGASLDPFLPNLSIQEIVDRYLLCTKGIEGGCKNGGLSLFTGGKNLNLLPAESAYFLFPSLV